MDYLKGPFKNGYFFLINKKTKKEVLVEHCEGDWYFPQGVKKTNVVIRCWNVRELLFERPIRIRDSDLHTVVKNKREENPYDKKTSKKVLKRGRVKVDGSQAENNSKYLTEYKTMH